MGPVRPVRPAREVPAVDPGAAIEAQLYYNLQRQHEQIRITAERRRNVRLHVNQMLDQQQPWDMLINREGQQAPHQHDIGVRERLAATPQRVRIQAERTPNARRAAKDERQHAALRVDQMVIDISDIDDSDDEWSDLDDMDDVDAIYQPPAPQREVEVRAATAAAGRILNNDAPSLPYAHVAEIPAAEIHVTGRWQFDNAIIDLDEMDDLDAMYQPQAPQLEVEVLAERPAARGILNNQVPPQHYYIPAVEKPAAKKDMAEFWRKSDARLGLDFGNYPQAPQAYIPAAEKLDAKRDMAEFWRIDDARLGLDFRNHPQASQAYIPAAERDMAEFWQKDDARLGLEFRGQPHAPEHDLIIPGDGYEFGRHVEHPEVNGPNELPGFDEQYEQLNVMIPEFKQQNEEALAQLNGRDERIQQARLRVLANHRELWPQVYQGNN